MVVFSLFKIVTDRGWKTYRENVLTGYKFGLYSEWVSVQGYVGETLYYGMMSDKGHAPPNYWTR